MANIAKHKFQSTRPDSADTSLVRKTEWNDEHVFAGGNHGAILSRDTGQTDGAAWISSVTTGQFLLSQGVGSVPVWGSSATDLTLSNNFILTERTSDPTTADLAANGAVAVYNKNNTMVFAYNNAGTMTYIKLNLNGSDTVWSHNTTVP